FGSRIRSLRASRASASSSVSPSTSRLLTVFQSPSPAHPAAASAFRSPSATPTLLTCLPCPTTDPQRPSLTLRATKSTGIDFCLTICAAARNSPRALLVTTPLVTRFNSASANFPGLPHAAVDRIHHLRLHAALDGARTDRRRDGSNGRHARLTRLDEPSTRIVLALIA